VVDRYPAVIALLADVGRLREARKLATKLVGGDDSNISIVHPIRWPGSWHRKGTPRLAETVAFSDDNEVDLTEAVERLRDASGADAGLCAESVADTRIAAPASTPNCLGFMRRILAPRSG
jgi:hypothetical protein